jgi:hypothetical protein
MSQLSSKSIDFLHIHSSFFLTAQNMTTGFNAAGATWTHLIMTLFVLALHIIRASLALNDRNVVWE